MKETVSDIIDQRLDLSQLGDHVETIASDSDGVRAWRNYHLIGDVIRGDVESAGPCIIDRVSSALADEPTVLAPSSGSRNSAAIGSGGVGGKTGRASDASRGDALKAAGLFAVAASLALVAVITQVPVSDDPASGQAVVRNDTAPPAGIGVEEGDGAVVEAQAFASEFGQMLVEHGEFSATTGLNGLLAYAKVVSNEPLGD
jgi:sigma-E factor negative regulatory protein RseA